MPTQYQVIDSTVAKYVSQYGEPESAELDCFPGVFIHGLVIPVYREDSCVIERFANFTLTHPKTLLIFVINRPEGSSDTKWTMPFLALKKTARWQSANQTMTLCSIQPESDSAILLVDRCIEGPALPKDQGVGLARKIGADILSALINTQKVLSPWIYNTDADAHLPHNYFSAIQQADHQTAAIVYPFKHVFFRQHTTNTEIKRLPTLLYEFSLHYYVQGLKKAGSPYAYHTLGSTITVHFSYYAKVRGFPKRSAAEDFYLLNKLTKTGKTLSIGSPVIELQARESTRVPFGTGPAVINLAANANPLTMPLYHPASFDYLQIFIQTFNELCERENPDIATCIDNNIKNSGKQYLHAEYLYQLLMAIEFPAALAHSFKHGKKEATRLQHLHHWFDGFRTLKFIHYLRDNHLGTIPYQHWKRNYFINNNDKCMTALVNHIEQSVASTLL